MKSAIAAATFPIWGTTATVVSTEPERLVSAVSKVEDELDGIGRTCSRFRSDSDICRVNSNAGSWTQVDSLFVVAMEAALRGARLTDGLVDPTVGSSMLRIGYDRDFADISPSGSAIPMGDPAPGWWLVEIRSEDSLVRVPEGVSLDLGATAKALAADLAACAACEAAGCGVLVSIGGDASAAGPSPEGGWTIGIADDHRSDPEPGESVSIAGGGVATSSVRVRRWSRDGASVHHIIDPRTGDPAEEVWRTVSVAAATCVDANIASTASIVMGKDAPGWLASRELPARLVRADEEIVRVGAWPERVAA